MGHWKEKGRKAVGELNLRLGKWAVVPEREKGGEKP